MSVHSAPVVAKPKGEIAAIKKALGKKLERIEEAHGEIGAARQNVPSWSR